MLTPQKSMYWTIITCSYLLSMILFFFFICHNQVSEVIMEEDDEQANIDRNIAEIDDQM